MKAPLSVRITGALFLLLSSALYAQVPTLTFTASTVTGAGSVVPVLTWSTSPAAASCTASGDPAWIGAKLSNGTATLVAITSSRTYALACTWPGDTSVTLRWTLATTNIDGSPYTNPKGFHIHSGTVAANVPTSTPKVLLAPAATSDTLTGLAAGTWFFCVRSLSTADVTSDCSANVSKLVTASQTVTRTVAITVNPKPNPPTALVAE